MNKEIEIPEGYEAIIEGNKVIFKRKESEDERIRNLIYCLIRDRSDNQKLLEHNGVSVDKALAYLERHTESTWTEEDESFVKHILPRILEPNGWTLEQNEADKGYLKEFISRQKNKYVEKQKEQKPVSGSSEKPNYHAEWSEEDEEMLQRIIRYTESEYQDWCNDKYGHSEIVSDGKQSCLERLDWLKNRLKSLRPQPKQEWSEEEEKDIQEASDCLRDYANNCVQGGNSKLYVQSLADRIESLSPSWKHSEEQTKGQEEPEYYQHFDPDC